MTRSATLRRVTGHIAEFAFLLTRRACLRWHGCCVEKSAVAAFPKSQVALGTDISREFPFSSVAAVGTRIVIFFVFHFFTSFLFVNRTGHYNMSQW